MREAELRQSRVVNENWKVFWLGTLIALLLLALGYYITQYVVKHHGIYVHQTYPVGNESAPLQTPKEPMPQQSPGASEGNTSVTPDGAFIFSVPDDHSGRRVYFT